MNFENQCMLDFIFEEDDCEYEYQVVQQCKRRWIQRPRMNWFFIYDDNDFHLRYRLHKPQFLLVLSEISSSLCANAVGSHIISPIIQLLVALRFYATGSFLITIADFNGISKAAAVTIVHRVSSAIALLSKKYIKLPSTPEEIMETQMGNFQKAAFPRLIGAIDCVHVRIRSYGGENAEVFRNRKGFFSFNVQVVANSKLQILDIVARWPGSSHDATIFHNSALKHRFQFGEMGNGLLLGDSGYSNLPFLMVPLINPRTPSVKFYTMNPKYEQGPWLKGVLACGHEFFPSDIQHETIDYEECNNIFENYNHDLHSDERQYLIQNYFQKCL
ncbi:putative nuclease HARBI1 [Prorops nasuta]|uniref:putative nuclease HARBI1 n=1 Tax=Prorops nasuta TaxID=863751 RepID=UPI0034CFD7A2